MKSKPSTWPARASLIFLNAKWKGELKAQTGWSRLPLAHG